MNLPLDDSHAQYLAFRTQQRGRLLWLLYVDNVDRNVQNAPYTGLFSSIN